MWRWEEKGKEKEEREGKRKKNLHQLVFVRGVASVQVLVIHWCLCKMQWRSMTQHMQAHSIHSVHSCHSHYLSFKAFRGVLVVENSRYLISRTHLGAYSLSHLKLCLDGKTPLSYVELASLCPRSHKCAVTRLLAKDQTELAY